ncbi:MAG: hypothetical protein AAGD40_10340 [Pseudomonadota bacterium]
MPILSRRSLIVSGLATTLAGCANRGFVAAAPANSIASYGLDALKPLDLSTENLTRITVCSRPLRPTRAMSKRVIFSNWVVNCAG